MIASTRDFWIFHSVYWAAVGLALFLYGLTYGHWEVALVRNIYNPLVGFACSYLIRAVYTHRLPAGFSKRLAMILFLSFLGALVSSLMVNPVTYSLLGYDMQSLTLQAILQDGLYFLLFYLIWSLLYLQLMGKTLFGNPSTPTQASLQAISVTKHKQKLILDPLNITYIQANGDYVEFFTERESYLKQGTISFYEKSLSSGPFVRVHRSIIINRQKIESISGPSKGQYWIRLGPDQEIRSSRNYQQVVSGMLPEAL
jgi:DNA-binding LytR/AlgR family response regulator